MFFCVCQRQHFTRRSWGLYSQVGPGTSFWWEFGAEETVKTATESETTALRAKLGNESLVLLVVAETLCCL